MIASSNFFIIILILSDFENKDHETKRKTEKYICRFRDKPIEM